jgi:hypothetical protein
MFLKSFQLFIPKPLIVHHPVPYGTELRRDEAIAAFSTILSFGHEAGIEQDAEVLRAGRFKPSGVEDRTRQPSARSRRKLPTRMATESGTTLQPAVAR